MRKIEKNIEKIKDRFSNISKKGKDEMPTFCILLLKSIQYREEHFKTQYPQLQNDYFCKYDNGYSVNIGSDSIVNNVTHTVKIKEEFISLINKGPSIYLDIISERLCDSLSILINDKMKKMEGDIYHSDLILSLKTYRDFTEISYGLSIYDRDEMYNSMKYNESGEKV